VIPPLQIPGIGTSTLLIGGIVFAVVLVAILAVVFIYVDPWGGEPWDDFAEATQKIVDSENADAIAFMPYSDGPLIPKPAIYDRELLGATAVTEPRTESESMSMGKATGSTRSRAST